MKKRVTCELKNVNFNCREKNALEKEHTTNILYKCVSSVHRQVSDVSCREVEEEDSC